MVTPTSTSAAMVLKRIEQGAFFQASVIFIIVLSALSIGVKTYDIPPLFENTLAALDVGITIFFLSELMLRFSACDDRKRFLFDGWNLFDTLIVIGSLLPIGNADAVLIGRLLRVFRVLRLVSVIPELRSLINSLLLAIPRMGYIALLMFIIFYIYAAVGSMFFAQVDETLWGDVSISMLTLFRVATFEDWTDIMYSTMTIYPLSWLYYLTFIFLTAFVFLNMMVGVILEVMTTEHNKTQVLQAHEERHDMAEQLKQIQTQMSRMEKLLEGKRQ